MISRFRRTGNITNPRSFEQSSETACTSATHLTAPGSPQVLCNPFSLPTLALTLEESTYTADTRTCISRHLVCELPDIYLVPPGHDVQGLSVCLWSSKLDGKVSSFLDSVPNTPVGAVSVNLVKWINCLNRLHLAARIWWERLDLSLSCL